MIGMNITLRNILLIVVRDADGIHDLIGSVTTTFREFTFGSYQLPLINPKKAGNIGYKSSGAFAVDEIVPLPATIERIESAGYKLTCRATKLDRKDVMGKSDAYFEVYSSVLGPSGKPLKLYRSEVVKQELAPDWAPFNIAIEHTGGLDGALTFKVFDWDANGAHDCIFHLLYPQFRFELSDIGSLTVTLRECLFGNLTIPLYNNGKSNR